MQAHLRASADTSAVIGPPLRRPGRQGAAPPPGGAAELDAAFTDLVGADAALFRVPVPDSSTSCGCSPSPACTRARRSGSTAAEIVDVVLEGALDRLTTTATQ